MEKELQIFNSTSGEIIGDYYEPKLKMTNIEFALFFAKNLFTLAKSKPSIKEKILAEIIDSMDKKNIVYLLKNFKEPVAKKYNINSSYIGTVISELIEKQILYKIGRGVYIVNPYIYGKGNTSEIVRLRWDFDALFENGNVNVKFNLDKVYRKEG